MAGHKEAGKGELDIGVRDLGMDGSRITVAGSGHGLEGVTKVQGGGEGGLEAGTAGAAWVGGRFSETQSSMAAKELEVAMHSLTGGGGGGGKFPLVPIATNNCPPPPAHTHTVSFSRKHTPTL